MAERNERGQFVKGNPGGPGRPRREVEQQYLDVTFGAVTEDEWRKVIKAMLQQAKRGNVAAATWLGNYVLGKPQESLDVTSGGERVQAITTIEVVKDRGSGIN